MDVTGTLSQIAALSVDDRIRLVEAIWDTVAVAPGQLELTPAQREELERRMQEHAVSPEAVVSWETVRDEALARHRR